MIHSLPARRRLGSRVIPAPRAHAELARAVRMSVDLHLPIAALALGITRFISNRVLRANVVGHGSADRVNFVQSLREESDAARPFRNDLQRPLGVLWVFFLLQNANRINRRSILRL